MEQFLLCLCCLLLLGWTLSNAQGSFLNWKLATTFHSHMQGFSLMTKLNDEIQARVNKRVKVYNSAPVAYAGGPGGIGEVQNFGADAAVQEQPPEVQMTHIIDEAHEINRELNRKRNPSIEWTSRDDFGVEEA